MFKSEEDLETRVPASSSYLTVEDTGSRTIKGKRAEGLSPQQKALIKQNILKAAEYWRIAS